MTDIMSKKWVYILFVLVSFFTSSKGVFATTIKIATLSPEGTFWMTSMREGAEEITRRTDGRVKFKFYPGGVMGNDNNVLRKMRIGQLQGGAVTTGAISDQVPDVIVYGLPYVFSSIEEAEETRKITDPMLIDLIEKHGYISFGFAQGGFTYLMSKNRITGFDDLRQQKSWVPENSEVGYAVYEYIGVTPVSLPIGDVLTGLQTGLINTVITSPIGALALQWHTHVNYVVDYPLNYLSATLIIDKKVFDKLSKGDQAVVREVMSGVYRKIDQQNKKDNAEARQALINNGVKFVKLSDDEKKEWFKAGEYVLNKMNKEFNYNQEFYQTVERHSSGVGAAQ